jgi:uncharacterized protein with HEPN domain
MIRTPVERLEDAIAFAQRAALSARKISRETSHFDCVDFAATLFNLAMVGEALNAVPDEVRTLAPEIRWAGVRGMRNLIVHQYWQIDSEIVLETVRIDLPSLIASLRVLLAAGVAGGIPLTSSDSSRFEP